MTLDLTDEAVRTLKGACGGQSPTTVSRSRGGLAPLKAVLADDLGKAATGKVLLRIFRPIP